MENRFASTLLGLAAFITLLLSIRPVAADWDQAYCSKQNTGSSDAVYTWPYQSNGNCTNHCKEDGSGDWAFAVLQYTDCWCSDYIPADQEDMSGCLQDCPGFPSDKCGNKDKGLYIYIKMDGTPSGTQGASTSAAATSATATSTEASSSQAATTDQSSSQTSSSSHTTSATEEPVTMPTVVTESGRIITRTLLVAPTSAESTIGSSQQKSSNVGAIAGGVAGGIVGLLAIVGGLLFLLWRRRKQRALQENGQDGGSSGGITRNVSTMSRAGLLGGRGEKTPPPLVTNFGSQRSRHDDESITPMTSSTRRFSQPILVDSRLNPQAVLTFHGANASRESFGSIDDSRDYGRQLNVRNPDSS